MSAPSPRQIIASPSFQRHPSYNRTLSFAFTNPRETPHASDIPLVVMSMTSARDCCVGARGLLCLRFVRKRHCDPLPCRSCSILHSFDPSCLARGAHTGRARQPSIHPSIHDRHTSPLPVGGGGAVDGTAPCRADPIAPTALPLLRALPALASDPTEKQLAGDANRLARTGKGREGSSAAQRSAAAASDDGSSARRDDPIGSDPIGPLRSAPVSTRCDMVQRERNTQMDHKRRPDTPTDDGEERLTTSTMGGCCTPLRCDSLLCLLVCSVSPQRPASVAAAVCWRRSRCAPRGQ